MWLRPICLKPFRMKLLPAEGGVEVAAETSADVTKETARKALKTIRPGKRRECHQKGGGSHTARRGEITQGLRRPPPLGKAFVLSKQ